MSRSSGGQVGLAVGPNVGESPDIVAGLSLLPRGLSGHVGGLVSDVGLFVGYEVEGDEVFGNRGGPLNFAVGLFD